VIGVRVVTLLLGLAACHAPAVAPAPPLVMTYDEECIGPAERVHFGDDFMSGRPALHGIVTDSNKRSLPAIEVDVLADDRVIGSASTDDGGMYRIGGLPPGTYTIRFSYGASVVSTETISIGEKITIQQTSLDITHVPRPRWCA
jgi:Carboxypeptidase regulatory-like domain